VQRLSFSFGLAALLPLLSKRSVLAVSNRGVGKARRSINLAWNSPEKEDAAITVGGGQDWCCRLGSEERSSAEEALRARQSPRWEERRSTRSVRGQGAGHGQHPQCAVFRFLPERSPAPGQLAASQRGTGLAAGLRSVAVPALPLCIARGRAAVPVRWWPVQGTARSTARARGQGSPGTEGSQPARRRLLLLLLHPLPVAPSLLMEKVFLSRPGRDGPAAGAPIPAGSSGSSSHAGVRVSAYRQNAARGRLLWGGGGSRSGVRGTHLHFARGKKCAGAAGDGVLRGGKARLKHGADSQGAGSALR